MLTWWWKCCCCLLAVVVAASVLTWLARYIVIFTEYGNSQECSLAVIRPPTEPGAVVAEGYAVGDSVWAMWDEDHKWYLAQVSEKMAGGKYRVTFTEYGNEQVCSPDMMRAGVDKASATAAKTNTGKKCMADCVLVWACVLGCFSCVRLPY